MILIFLHEKALKKYKKKQNYEKKFAFIIFIIYTVLDFVFMRLAKDLYAPELRFWLTPTETARLSNFQEE